MFCTGCGKEISEGSKYCLFCGLAVTPMPDEQPTEVVVGHASHASEQSQFPQQFSPPQSGSSKPKGRTLLWVLVAVAIVIVAGGGGAGGYLLLRGDDQPGDSNLAVTETTTITAGTAVTTTTSGISTTTVGRGADNSVYLAAVERMSTLLQQDDVMIAKPNLATKINNTIPDVPMSVDRQLQDMLDSLESAEAVLERQEIPAEFSIAHRHLMDAAYSMQQRIIATLSGVEAARNTGVANAGDAYFDAGRDYRDDYLESLQRFEAALPVGY
jgi:hypothetical protein